MRGTLCYLSRKLNARALTFGERKKRVGLVHFEAYVDRGSFFLYFLFRERGVKLMRCGICLYLTSLSSGLRSV